MGRKVVKLELTELQFQAVTSAISEYSEICEGESEGTDGSRSGLYSYSKALDKVLNKMFKQKRDQDENEEKKNQSKESKNS